MPANAMDSLAALAGDGGEHGVRYAFATVVKNQPSWRVRSISLQEGISELYVLDVELDIEPQGVDAAAMLGKGATLRWDGRETRFVHGIVASVEDGASTPDVTIVHVKIVPALSVLAYTSTSRIFSAATIQEVVEEVLGRPLRAFGRKATFNLMQNTYPRREYITQHRETDIAFVMRLLAEEGLWYYFKHPEGDNEVEALVITDAPEFTGPTKEDPEVELVDGRLRGAFSEALMSFTERTALGTTGVRVRQFDWTKPSLLIDVKKTVKVPVDFELEQYEHGDLTTYAYDEPRYRKDDSAMQAQLRIERHQASGHGFSGESNVTALQPGHFMRLRGKEYLITAVRHGGSTLTNTGHSRARGDYKNSFSCLPREQAYRPRRLDKPRIFGPQTAIVVDGVGNLIAPASSADGADIVTDKHGRVRVKFHWDVTPAGQGGTNSCWLRVAQSLAGRGWGFQFLPRVGMEVIVGFVDGDPDRPVVTGCLYNGLNVPPYETPTQSGMKLASSVDRSRYNELRFEHAKDHEQIFVRAQKDYVEEVLNDHKTTVTGTQTNTVKKSQSESVQGNQSLSVGGKRTKTVGGEKENGEENTIQGERKTTVSKKNTETFNDEHELTVVKAVKETYHETHDRTVTGKQTLKAEADKLEHVMGSYELTTDTALIFNQGATKLTYEGGKVTLDAANEISVTRGPAQATIDTAGHVTLKTSGSITLEVGGNKLVISQSGIELNGMQISATAGPSELALTPASASLKSVNVTVEATAICAAKGAMLNLN